MPRNQFFVKKIKLWTFPEILLIRPHFTANMLQLAKFKKNWKIFIRKHIFFGKNPTIRTIWEVLVFQSHSTTTLLLLPNFKIFIFFKKSVIFLGKKWTFWEIPIFQSNFTIILLSLAIFKTSCFFWKNSSNFFYKNQILNVLRYFILFCRFLRQIF